MATAINLLSNPWRVNFFEDSKSSICCDLRERPPTNRGGVNPYEIEAYVVHAYTDREPIQDSEVDLQHETILVRSTLEHVIALGQRDARLVAAFLNNAGIPAGPVEEGEAHNVIPAGPVGDMLLNLAAALHLKLWENQGLMDRLPADLPTSRAAMRAAGAEAFAESRSQNPKQLPTQVFNVWYSHFVRSSITSEMGDVIRDEEASSEALIEAMAILLWENRHLMMEGGET